MRRVAVILVVAATLSACAGAPPSGPAEAGKGKVAQHNVRSSLPGLEAGSAVSVYLPAGYAGSRWTCPVLYLLHGSGGTNLTFLGQGYGPERWMSEANVSLILDRLAADGRVRPMIVVCPDMTMVDQDFLVRDLVPFVDRTFRTSRGRSARAIAGHSSGGFDALGAAAAHPELFSLAGGLASAGLELMAFRVEGAATTLRQKASAVRFWLYVGANDQYGLAAENRDFAEALRKTGLPLEYTEDEGDHISSVPQQLEKLVLYCNECFK